MNNSIASLSRALGWMATIGVFVVPFATVITFALAGHTGATFFMGLDGTLDRLLTDAPFLSRLAALPFALAPDIFMMWALWSLRTLMFHYSRGEVFTFAPLSALNNLAIALFAGVIAGIAVNPLISLLLTWHLGVGHRHIIIAFGTQEFADLFAAGVVLVIARVMAEARRIADENAKFV
jgi:hypothetical protein